MNNLFITFQYCMVYTYNPLLVDESYESAPSPKSRGIALLQRSTVGQNSRENFCLSGFGITHTHTRRNAKTLKEIVKLTTNSRAEEWGRQPIMLTVVRTLTVSL